MAYVPSDGPPHYKVCTHTWTPFSLTPTVTLNDDGATYPAPPVLPWIVVARVQNWRHGIESDDNRAPRTAGDGEITYPGHKLGKTMVYELEVRAATVKQLDQTMTTLVTAFENTSDEGTMVLAPHEGGTSWQYAARVLALTPDEDWDYSDEGRGWVVSHGYQLSLRLSDPYFAVVGDLATRSA